MKYEVGDEVIYRKRKFEVFGVKETTLAIWQPCNFKLVDQCDVSPTKKKNELKVGDKFIAISGEYRVEYVGWDNYYDCTDYYARSLDGEAKGSMDSILSSRVDEIIYD